VQAPGGWDNNTEILAAIFDAIQVQIRQFQTVNSERAPQGDLPRIPRPYEVEEEPETVDLTQLNSFLEV
jgi:hypothetical protein